MRKQQRLFYERQTNNSDQLFVVLCGQETYAFTVCGSLEENSKDNEVTLWSLVSLATTNVDSN